MPGFSHGEWPAAAPLGRASNDTGQNPVRTWERTLNGSELRLGRLFAGPSKRTFIIAYDHGLTSDQVRPAGPPAGVLERIMDCEPDGILLSAGLLSRFGHLFAVRNAPAAIVRTDFMLLGDGIPDYGERY